MTSKGPMSGAGSSDSNMESLVEYRNEIVSKKNDSMGEMINLFRRTFKWETFQGSQLNQKLLIRKLLTLFRGFGINLLAETSTRRLVKTYLRKVKTFSLCRRVWRLLSRWTC